MPYIKQEERSKLNNYIIQLENIIKRDIENMDSKLAYVFYKLLKDTYGKIFHSWGVKSEALKILEDVKSEYYRRILTPHAIKKIKENGDI